MNDAAFFILAAAAGLCVGSLITVVAWRLPLMLQAPDATSFNLWLPRSHCPSCKTMLVWYDNLPLISWLSLRGRCRYCRKKIPYSYPLTELGAMLLSLAMAMLFSAPALFLSGSLLCWTLLALTRIDSEHGLLPDRLTLPLLWAGLIFHVSHTLTSSSLADGVMGTVLGYLSLWLLACSYRAVRNQEGIGMGDAKLLAALGAWLGWQMLPLLLVMASGAGLAWLCIARIAVRRDIHTPFPFGPCLAAAGALLFIFQNAG